MLSAVNAAVLVAADGQDTAYTVLTNDLLETNLSNAIDALTPNAGENTAAGGNDFTVLANGAFGDISTDGRFESYVIQDGVVTYELDVSTNTLGYDISSIITYAGWADNNRGTQAYTVSYSVVGDSGFTDITTVNNTPDLFTQERTTITENSTGILATGVDAVRFTFGTQQFSGVGYKELDVVGSATVPEPSSSALIGLGSLALLARRKRS